jgi:cell wall-associated NlpC family hydrolase
MLALEAATEKLAETAPKAAGAFGLLTAATGRLGGVWGALNAPVTLFGGLLNRVLPRIVTSVGVWHVLADSIIEVGAVLGPAAVAFGAFGIAGSDAAKEIATRMQDVHTVMDATGQAVPPMTNAMEQLHKAVQPQVYQLFGDAITIMNAKTGIFQSVAKGTATVVDQLAARMTYAITQGGGFSQFMQHAVHDAAGLGAVIGNVAGTFGNLGRAIPGIAEVLLSVAVGFTNVVEHVSAATIGITRWILILHGAVLWTGLAVTAIAAFAGAMARLVLAFVEFNAAQAGKTIQALTQLGSVFVSAGLAVISFSQKLFDAVRSVGLLNAAMFALEAISPLGWFLIITGALAALTIYLAHGKDAARDFNKSMQDAVNAAPISRLSQTISSSIVASQARVASSTRDLNAAMKTAGPAISGVAGHFTQNYNPAIDHAATANAEYRQGLAQLTAQQQLVGGRVSALSKEYGGNVQALGALNAAGITTAQITDTNKEHWAQALIQVESTTAAYKAMGTQAGTLGNDLDVLGRTETDQYQAISKLNQAYGAFISDVTGGQQSFDTVAQGFSTLSDHTGKLNLTLGKLKVSYKDTQSAIDSLTPQGIALNQAFADQVTNVDKLFSSWRTAGIAGSQFNQGVAAAIAPLEKYAAGSQEATAMLVALAQEAGYQGPNSLSALNKYLGITSGQLKNTSGDTKALKDITNQATVQTALLTGAMQAQGSYIASTLIGDINNAILKYNGVEKAASAYGDAIARSGRQSDAAKSARDTLVKDIIAAGRAAGDTTGQIAAMISKVLGIPAKAATQIVVTAEASGGVKVQSPGLTAKEIMLSKLAAGGMIRTGTGPTADDVHILASKGEYVTQAKAVSKYGTGAMDAVNQGRAVIAYAGGGPVMSYPGYASGGIVNAGRQAAALPGAASSALSATTGAALAGTLTSVLQTMKQQLLAGSGPAVLAYAESFKGAPYVWGGSSPSGWDCSGMVSYVLDHFGLFHGRTDAAGLQRWSRPAPADLGAMAFYGSPAHHVGFVAGPSTLFSALGRAYGTTFSALNMGDNSGYGIPPQGYGTAGGAPGGATPAGKIQELAFSMLQQRGWGNQWPSFSALEMSEAGWNMNARNPSSGAYGLAQFINGAGEYAQYGGTWLTATGQLTGMMNYIAQRYGSPAAAWAFHQRNNSYAGGGLVQSYDQGGLLPPGKTLAVNNTGMPELVVPMATGGKITGAAFGPQMASAQNREYTGYGRLSNAYTYDLAHAKAGSWTAGHRAGITSELGTLKRYQANEQSAYNTTLSQSGSAGSRSHLRSMLNLLLRVTKDVDLSHSHPALTKDLQHWIGVLTGLTGLTVSGPVAVKGAAAAKLQFIPWLNQVKGLQASELGGYRGLLMALSAALAHARPGSWLATNRKAVQERLYAVAKRQADEVKYYSLLAAHATGSVGDITALPGRIASLNNVVSAELANLQPALLGHAGAAPAQVKALQGVLAKMQALARTPPYSPPWDPGKLGPSHTATPHVLTFDRGGILPPGLSLSYNGLGRPEHLTPSGGQPAVHITIGSSGNTGFDAFMLKWLRGNVHVHGGTGPGSVERAFGRRG